MNGKPLIYLDSAATSRKPWAMIDRLRTLYAEEYAKVEEGHALSQHATRLFEQVRAKVTLLINAAEHASNVIPWQMACEDTHARLRVVPVTGSGIAVRAGELDATPMLKALGMSTALRASFMFYNTRQEADALAEAWRSWPWCTEALLVHCSGGASGSS